MGEKVEKNQPRAYANSPPSNKNRRFEGKMLEGSDVSTEQKKEEIFALLTTHYEEPKWGWPIPRGVMEGLEETEKIELAYTALDDLKRLKEEFQGDDHRADYFIACIINEILIDCDDLDQFKEIAEMLADERNNGVEFNHSYDFFQWIFGNGKAEGMQGMREWHDVYLDLMSTIDYRSKYDHDNSEPDSHLFKKAAFGLLEKCETLEHFKIAVKLAIDYEGRYGRPFTCVNSVLPKMLERFRTIDDFQIAANITLDYSRYQPPFEAPYSQHGSLPDLTEHFAIDKLPKLRDACKSTEIFQEIAEMVHCYSDQFNPENYIDFLSDKLEQDRCIEEVWSWHGTIKKTAIEHWDAYGSSVWKPEEESRIAKWVRRGESKPAVSYLKNRHLHEFADYTRMFFRIAQRCDTVNEFEEWSREIKNIAVSNKQAQHHFFEKLLPVTVRKSSNPADLRLWHIEIEEFVFSIELNFRIELNIRDLLSAVSNSRHPDFLSVSIQLIDHLAPAHYISHTLPGFLSQFDDADEIRSWLLLEKSTLVPTVFLAKELSKADDKKQRIKEWHSIINGFSKGKFDHTNELHRNLEYTRFRRMVDHEKVRRHLKNRIGFEEYLSIFGKSSEQGLICSDMDRFEIRCVAHEAKLLRDFILKVKEKADEQGRKVLVVPNLSYGYLPVSPIIEELSGLGVEFCIGTKVGSTESHHNKEVVDSRLFKGQRGKIMKGQPVIIVVDGTKHLVSRDDGDLAARYPDAYQGYLNQTIAINEALGILDVDYSNIGKTEEDMSRLRSVEEFQRLVRVYRHVSKGEAKQPYSFHLWNTASMNLTIRGHRRRIDEIAPYDPDDLEGPTMIFCNIGVLDEQIPAAVKQGFEGLNHTPAYFDDSEKIIDFDFGFDEYGVRYLNLLETEVKKAYASMNGKSVSISARIIPEIVRYMNSWKSRLAGYFEEAA